VPKKKSTQHESVDMSQGDAPQGNIPADEVVQDEIVQDEVVAEDVAQTEPPQFDRAAADQMAADIAAAEEPTAEQEQPDPITSLREQLKAAEDRTLRSRAELENYRKRIARQMEEERRYANLPLMRDLLPVCDNLDRAIEAAEKQHDVTSLLEGVKMVAQQLENVLQQHHCTKINALSEPFNPHLHEAISQQPSEEHPADTVIMVTQTGFQLHERVIRPSRVIVAAENQ